MGRVRNLKAIAGKAKAGEAGNCACSILAKWRGWKRRRMMEEKMGEAYGQAVFQGSFRGTDSPQSG